MNNLKKLRKAKNLTQNELSNQIKIPRETYINYELGTREASYETLIKLSKFYNVPINYLLGEENQNLVLITKAEFESLKEIKALAKIIDEIEKRNQ